jgi:hypothetical protein
MEIIICLDADDGPSTGTPVYPEADQTSTAIPCGASTRYG